MKSFGCSVIVALGLLRAQIVSAEDLVIGHVSLRLGMPQQEVLTGLGKEFDPKQVSVVEGKYLLWTKSETGMPYSAGSVSFRHGKLYRASKAWWRPGVMGKDPVEGLFSALAQIVGQSGKTCKVKAETLQGPAGGTDVRLVTVELPPDRKVLVKIYKPHPGPGEHSFQGGPEVDEYLVEVPSSR